MKVLLSYCILTTCSAPLNLLNLGWCYKLWVPCFEDFSTPHSYDFWTQLFASGSSSQIPLVWISSFMKETTFHSHTIQQIFIYILWDSLHYAKFSFTWVFSRRFSVSCVPFSMLGSPCRTGCDGVCFLVHGIWDNRDVSVAGVCDFIKECVSFVMLSII